MAQATAHEPLLKALDPPRLDHHGSINKLRKKHKVIARNTLRPQRDDTPKEPSWEREPPTIATPKPPGG
ncbi:hypothetical protein BHM03_00008480 [Ensete ventricosum]|nr:hypothetical protein BHM03_00008480 [Ensete ventricosum]